jgi:hypothetical protein
MNSVSAVVEHIFTHYPQVGRRAGRHDLDGTLPAVAPRDVGELDALLAAASAGLDALPPNADPEVRADLSTAVRVIADERFRVVERGRVHPVPASCLDEIGVSCYLRGNYAPFADRVAALERHLAAVPSFLDAAAGTLGPRLPAGERINGIEDARARAAGMRDVIGHLLTERPELAGGPLAGLAEDASAACLRFADAVGKTAPASALMGPDRLAGYLMAAEGVDRPVGELLDDVDAEVRRIVARLDALTTELGQSDRRDAYELMARQVPEGPVVDTLTRMVDRLRQFWADQDVVTITGEQVLDIRSAYEPASSAAVVFDAGGPLETVPQPHILHVPEPRDARESAVARDYLNEPMLEMIAVHEVFPGHYLHNEARSPAAGVIRRCVPWFPGTAEGWAHYTEELAIEQGLAEGRPLVELAALRFQLEAAARLLAFLSVHSGRSKFGATVATVAALCGWSPERATREVLVVAADPSAAMYTLGRLHIRRWRALACAGAQATGLKSFHDRLIRCGHAPLSTVWRYHLDGQGGPSDGAVS